MAFSINMSDLIQQKISGKSFPQPTPKSNGDTGAPLDLKKLEPEITPSQGLTGIELRLRDVKIIDNSTPRIPPFPGHAKFYVLTMVISDKDNEPSHLDLKGFQKVGDNTTLPIDRTLYYWKAKKSSTEYPSQIHCMVSIIKSKGSLRNTGKTLKKIKESSDYVSIITKLASKSLPVVEAFIQLGNLIGGFLENVEDKPHYTRYTSITDLAGNFDQLGEQVFGDPPGQNYKATCNLVLFVQDKNRFNQLLKLAMDHDNISNNQLVAMKDNQNPIKGRYTLANA